METAEGVRLVAPSDAVGSTLYVYPHLQADGGPVRRLDTATNETETTWSARPLTSLAIDPTLAPRS